MLDRETREKLLALKSTLVERGKGMAEEEVGKPTAEHPTRIVDFLDRQSKHPPALLAGKAILYRGTRVFFLKHNGTWGVPLYSICKLFPYNFSRLRARHQAQLYDLLAEAEANSDGYHVLTAGSIRRLKQLLPEANGYLCWIKHNLDCLEWKEQRNVPTSPRTQLNNDSKQPTNAQGNVAVCQHGKTSDPPQQESKETKGRHSAAPKVAKDAPKQSLAIIESSAGFLRPGKRSRDVDGHAALSDPRRASGRLRSAYRTFLRLTPWARGQFSFALQLSISEGDLKTRRYQVEVQRDGVNLGLLEHGHGVSLDYRGDDALTDFLDQNPANIIYRMAAALQCAIEVVSKLQQGGIIGTLRIELTGETLVGHASHVEFEGKPIEPLSPKNCEVPGALSPLARTVGQTVNQDLYTFFVEAWKRHCTDHAWLRLPPRIWVPIKAREVFGIEQLFVELAEDYIAVEYEDTNSGQTHFLELVFGANPRLLGNSNQMVVALTCALLAIKDLLAIEVQERVVVSSKPRSYIRSPLARNLPSRKVVYAPQIRTIIKRAQVARATRLIEAASTLGRMAIHVVSDHIRRRPMTEAHYRYLKELEAHGRRFRNRLGEPLAISEDRTYTIVTSHHRGNLDTEVISKSVVDYVGFYKRLMMNASAST